MDRYAMQLHSDMVHALDEDGSGGVDADELRVQLEKATGVQLAEDTQLLVAVSKVCCSAKECEQQPEGPA